MSTSRYGPALSADSAAYLAASEHLAGGAGIRLYDGRPLTNFAPLLPAILAALYRLLGIAPLAAAHILNGCAFAATVLLAAHLFRRECAAWPVLPYMGTIAVVLSYPLIQAAGYVWTEPLFAVLVLLCLAALSGYMRKPSRRLLVALSVTAALACLLRYLGVALIATGGIAILMTPALRLRARAGHACLFGLASGLPVALWWTRNLLVQGAAFGTRSGAQVAPVSNIVATLDTLWSWYLPRLFNRAPVLVLVVIVALAGALVLIARKRAWRWSEVTPLPGIALLFCGVYILTLWLTSASAEVNAANDRLLTPIFVPTAVVSLSLTLALYRVAGERYSPRLLTGVALACFVAWSVYPLARDFKAVAGMVRDGAGGYNTAAWRQSELLRFLRTRPLAPDAVIYTNRPDALYVLAGIPAKLSPSTRTTYMGLARADLADVRSTWPERRPAYLAWFDRTRDYLYTLGELQAAHRLTALQQFSDGTLYRIDE